MHQNTYRAKINVCLKLFSGSTRSHTFLSLIVISMFDKLLAYLLNLGTQINVVMFGKETRIKLTVEPPNAVP